MPPPKDATRLTTSYWPADTSEPVLETTVGDVLRDAAAKAPDVTALIEGVPDPGKRRRWTYAELLRDAEQAARALRGRFEPGEKVAIWAPNLPEWIVMEFALALAGLTLVTVNPAYRPSELRYVLDQSGASGIFLVPEFRSPMAAYLDEVRSELPALRETVFFTDWKEFLDSARNDVSLPDVQPDDIAQIQYTSGTTGFPKGAELHHRGLTNNARFYGARIGLQRGSVLINPMPLFHTAGCGMGVLGAVQHQATHIPVVAFDPALMLELVETEKPSHIGAVPTMWIAMLDHPDRAVRDLSSLNVAVSGGSPVPAELVRRVERELGVTFSIVFGTTECSPLITEVSLTDSPDDRAESLGQPFPQTDVKVADPMSGEPVAPGELGELCARGYLVMRGYHRDPDGTAAAIDSDGWYHTGDLASMDERGYLRIEGRLKDMIIRGGENIYPKEIEDCLFGHPAIAEVAVVGIPDETWGEVVAAFVRLAAGARVSPAELRGWSRDRLAAYKTPARWEFVDEFPLTPSGKIQKFKLRESLAPRAARSLSAG
jgi:fatty-acyl-CoA synthase